MWDDGPMWSSTARERSPGSLPDLVPPSDGGGSSMFWDTGMEYPESTDRSSLVQVSEDVGEFNRDVDQSLRLESVECDVGGVLLEFVDDVVVHRGGGLELLSQVAVRSAGPPGLAGSSVVNPINVE